MVGEKKFRRLIPWILATLLGVTGLMVYEIRNLEFDYDFEKFYPEDDDDTRYFFDIRNKFASDNDFLLIGIPTNEQTFSPDFLKKTDRFTRELEKDSLVSYVLSLTNQEEFFLLQGGATARKKYIDFNDLDRKRDSLRVFKNKELRNTIISEDGKALGIYVKHRDFISKKNSDKLILHVRAAAEKSGLDNIILGGRTVGQKYYIEVMTSEMLLFLGLSAILVILFLLIAFRSIWGILIPQVVILLSLIWLIGGMGLFREPVNIILVTLPSVMFVVSMSDTIHLVSRYLDALRVSDDRFEAIMVAIREVGLATFLTSLTTAVGFFSLVFVNVSPVKSFGIVMGIGVLLAFVITFVTLPILFYYFPGPKHVLKSKDEHFWKKHLQKWFVFVLNNPVKILSVGALFVVVGITGAIRIVPNNFLMDDIDPDEQIKKDFTFIDEHFGGVRPFSLVLTAKDSTVNLWDPELLREIDEVEQFLSDEIQVNIRASLVTALKLMNRGSNLGDSSAYQLPTSKKKLRSYRRNLKIAEGGKVLRTMLDSTEQIMLISGTMPDVGNQEYQRLNARFQKFMSVHPIRNKLNYKVTGSAVLIDKNMSYLASSMVKGLLLSVVIVALIIGFIYRSARVLVISLIPNLIPLIVIAGIMGFVGIELKTSTAIIFTIAFGIAVDDTIHFLGKFKYELMKGKSVLYALKRSYLTTGKAMILTTLILCSGFLLLVLSSFMGTFYMGILLCVTLFVALLADLTILPALLLLFYRRTSK